MRHVDGPFIVGFLTIAILMLLLNLNHYSYLSFEHHSRLIKFSHSGFNWGVPFPMIYEGTCYPCDGIWIRNLIGIGANLTFATIASLIAGMVLTLSWPKVIALFRRDVNGENDKDT